MAEHLEHCVLAGFETGDRETTVENLKKRWSNFQNEIARAGTPCPFCVPPSGTLCLWRAMAFSSRSHQAACPPRGPHPAARVTAFHSLQLQAQAVGLIREIPDGCDRPGLIPNIHAWIPVPRLAKVFGNKRHILQRDSIQRRKAANLRCRPLHENAAAKIPAIGRIVQRGAKVQPLPRLPPSTVRSTLGCGVNRSPISYPAVIYPTEAFTKRARPDGALPKEGWATPAPPPAPAACRARPRSARARALRFGFHPFRHIRP